MSSGIALTHTAMYLGAAEDTAAVAKLDTQPVKPQTLAWQGASLQVAFLSSVQDGESRLQRIQWLLQQLSTRSPVFDGKTPVFLILPELNELDATLPNFVQQVTSAVPSLLVASASRIFPYGSAGALMAFNSAVRYLQQHSEQSVWLVAADSAANAERLNDIVASGQTDQLLSEGVMAIKLSADAAGYQLLCYETDACMAKEQASLTVVPYLFSAIAKQLRNTLTQLYLPDCGDSAITAQWLSHYQILRPVVRLETQLKFPTYSCGELGACGGLYRLWHALHHSSATETEFTTALLEISEQRYCAMLVLQKAAQ